MKPALLKTIKEHCKQDGLTVSEFIRSSTIKELKAYALIGKKI